MLDPVFDATLAPKPDLDHPKPHFTTAPAV
jgi:hypothetical protein